MPCQQSEPKTTGFFLSLKSFLPTPPLFAGPRFGSFHNPGPRRVGTSEWWLPLSHVSPATSDVAIVPPTQLKCTTTFDSRAERASAGTGTGWAWAPNQTGLKGGHSGKASTGADGWGLPAGVTKCSKEADTGKESGGRGCGDMPVLGPVCEKSILLPMCAWIPCTNNRTLLSIHFDRMNSLEKDWRSTPKFYAYFFHFYEFPLQWIEQLKTQAKTQ